MPDPVESAVRDLVKALRDELTKARPANDDHSEYMSTTEAASLARVSQGTIRRWVREGELTRHEAGSRVLVRRAELEKLLRASTSRNDMHLSPAERARRRFGG